MCSLYINLSRSIRIWLKRSNGQYWPSVCHFLNAPCTSLHGNSDQKRNRNDNDYFKWIIWVDQFLLELNPVQFHIINYRTIWIYLKVYGHSMHTKDLYFNRVFVLFVSIYFRLDLMFALSGPMWTQGLSLATIIYLQSPPAYR